MCHDACICRAAHSVTVLHATWTQSLIKAYTQGREGGEVCDRVAAIHYIIYTLYRFVDRHINKVNPQLALNPNTGVKHLKLLNAS